MWVRRMGVSLERCWLEAWNDASSFALSLSKGNYRKGNSHMKSQIPNLRSQIDPKSQTPNPISSLGFWTYLGFWILVLGLSTPALAITTESLDKAVGDIEATYQTIDDLTADFAQKTFVAVLGKNITNPGYLKWKKPGRFFIEYTGDQPRQYISDNKKMWIYVPGDTQVEVYDVSDKTISKEALEFMRGFGNIKKNFRITEWKKKGPATELTLVPLFSGAPYSKLKCHFNSSNLLDEVTIHNVTGNISTYKFSNIRINTALSEDLFRFKKPKGIKAVGAD